MSEACQVLSKEQFDKLSDAEKRIIIAKDVIKNIDEALIIATQGTYVSLQTESGYRARMSDNFERELDEFIKTEKLKCIACAKGSFFISYVMRNDNCKVNDYDAAKCPESLQRVLPFFSIAQMNLIETAFEGDRINYDEESGYNDLKAEEFYRQYEYPDDRLKAIAQNIIDNKGTFVL